MTPSLRNIGVDLESLKCTVYTNIGLKAKELELVGKSEFTWKPLRLIIILTDLVDEYCKVKLEIIVEQHTINFRHRPSM